MKKLTDIINYNTSSALGWTLIHSIWQGFAILLVFGILYYIFKPSITRYRLGIGALTLQFVAAIATFFTVYQPVSTSTALQSNLTFGNFFLNNPNLIFTPKKLSLLQQVEFFLQNNLDVFVMIWLVGTTLLLLRLLVGFTHVQSLKVQQVNPISADIQALMNNLLEKTQMPATIKLLESARASVPMTIGWLKPVVLLPVGMASGLTIKQLEAILAHELAHIKRYDYLVNIFQNFVEILFFFHPATWFISGKVRDERENCCDDFAVEICGDSLVLAKALTQVASYQQQPRLAMAFGAKRQTFMDRIKRIIGINDTKPMSYGNWAAVLGMILVVALGITYAQKEIKKDSPTVKDEKSTISKVDAIDNVVPVSVADNVEMPADTSKLDEVEAEMEALGKEMEKYSKEMEVLSRQMDEKYSRQMEKESEAMQQVQRKFQVPQRKIQDLSIQMQEVSLAMQKIHNKYMDEGKMPADAERKLKDLEKQERVLEKQMHEFEQQMNGIEAEMRPFEKRMQSLSSPMDSLGRLMERYSKPMDSLGKIMEAKGKVLEKLAKEEEARFKKDLESFAEMLYKDGLIKNKKDFEVRLKGDKLLIDLEPQSAAVYEKVWNWVNKTWGSRYKDLQEKDFRITINGDNVNFSTHGSRNYYRYGSTYPAPPAHPTSPRASVPAPPEPRNFRSSGSEVPPPPPPPTRARTPSTPKPPKPVRVGVVDKNFQITDALIRDNKGTCSVYVVSEKDGKSTAKAITATLVNDKWTAKGLKVGDKVILKSDVKVKNGDAVKLLAANN
ncbi:M56 family metallopeptidase [Emticicia sp. W12TSBA100-4]|uniref:M56 family metallopeptidase n=1 Tax=Emticicia sp. W12TSBA100-4 TaxID=3160965 RepID=UPI00330627A6